MSIQVKVGIDPDGNIGVGEAIALELAKQVAFPLGATPMDGGVNFSVFADKAHALELLLFDHVEDTRPAQVFLLDPRQHRTYHYWHAFVTGLQPGQIYAYRAIGPNAPERGLRYDPEKVLLDPYGRAVAVPVNYSREAAARPGDNAAAAMKSVVVDTSAYDWEGDRPLRRSFAATVIYEMHVRGFTRHPSSGVAAEKRGTYAGLIEKIPYLKDLGITAVELLPVYQFDPTTAAPGLINYWGYQPISFFAPHTAYSARQDPLGVLDEFRDMVKALHKAGIEVILDVVYNHTAESYGEGATLCYRGLANDTYYILDNADKSRYADYTGCGNTFNAGHAVVRRLICDSLRYWVQEMHVDGFRFDLASVLTRGEGGESLSNPPIIWDIESDPALAGTKLIAEAWDAAGLYQVGSFVGDAWKEWNGRFRDDVRSFVKSDNGYVAALAQRLTGSPDVYGKDVREPEQSVNFVTVHDGFTLNDVVSYNGKHNEANGEDNQDGSNENQSWNCGVEGPTDDPSVEELRSRQVKNFFTLLLTAMGAPLILMGDEVRRTQQGNNNAYCQDNEISWFDWTLLDKYRDIHRFVKQLIAARLHYGQGRTDTDTLLGLLQQVQVGLGSVTPGMVDEGYTSHALALARTSANGTDRFYLMINAYWEELSFTLPPVSPTAQQNWCLWIDTSRPVPNDIYAGDDTPPVVGSTCKVGPRSILVLVAKVGP
jgi:isoamylase